MLVLRNLQEVLRGNVTILTHDRKESVCDVWLHENNDTLPNGFLDMEVLEIHGERYGEIILVVDDKHKDTIISYQNFLWNVE